LLLISFRCKLKKVHKVYFCTVLGGESGGNTGGDGNGKEPGGEKRMTTSYDYANQIWWWSVKGFRVVGGSNFSLSHWRWWSSLQHSHTSVWECGLACHLVISMQYEFITGFRSCCWFLFDVNSRKCIRCISALWYAESRVAILAAMETAKCREVRNVWRHHIVTLIKFGDDRLRVLGSSKGQISVFPIDFDGRPYNTVTPPCERAVLLVISSFQYSVSLKQGLAVAADFFSM